MWKKYIWFKIFLKFQNKQYQSVREKNSFMNEVKIIT